MRLMVELKDGTGWALEVTYVEWDETQLSHSAVGGSGKTALDTLVYAAVDDCLLYEAERRSLWTVVRDKIFGGS